MRDTINDRRKRATGMVARFRFRHDKMMLAARILRSIEPSSDALRLNDVRPI